MSRYRRYGRYGKYGRYGRGYYHGPMGGMVAILARVLTLVLFGLMFLMASANYKLTEAFEVLFKGGEIHYSIPRLRNYAQAEYDAHFAGERYEDNLLMVFLPREEGMYEYDVMVIGGKHLDEDVMESFGALPGVWGDSDSKVTEERPMEKRLTDSIRNKVHSMTKSFTAPYYWGSPLDCSEKEGQRKALLINESELAIDTAKIEPALKKFAEKTNIGLVVIVADQDDVFQRYFPLEVVYTLALLVAALAVVTVVVIVVARNWKKWVPEKEEEEAEPEETMSDHDKLDDEYWKDRY